MCSNDFFFMLCSNALSGSPESYISHILVFTSVLGKCGTVFLPASVQERQIQLSP